MHSGIVVLNKPPQMTSQQAVTRVKRALGVKKAGHAGTLDPDVTGVLPVFIGSATRLTEYVLADEKRYDATLVLGSATDTQDASGKVLATADASGVSEQQIRDTFMRFVGPVTQIPPAYSAIKVQGKRAYELARSGIEVTLTARDIVIFSLEIYKIERVAQIVRVYFHVRCSKGTYIRTLCHDLGEALSIPAHMGRLVRTQSGPFHLGQAWDLDYIKEHTWSVVLPPEDAILHMHAIYVDSDMLQNVLYGQSILYQCEAMAPQDLVRVHLVTGELVAIYEITDFQDGRCRLSPKKVLWQVMSE